MLSNGKNKTNIGNLWVCFQPGGNLGDNVGISLMKKEVYRHSTVMRALAKFVYIDRKDYPYE